MNNIAIAVDDGPVSRKDLFEALTVLFPEGDSLITPDNQRGSIRKACESGLYFGHIATTANNFCREQICVELLKDVSGMDHGKPPWPPTVPCGGARPY